MMSRWAVDAITRRTLSREDMAAATIASMRKALTPSEKTSALVRS